MQNNDPRMRRMFRNSAVLLVVFLLGLVPALVRNLQLKRELARAESALALSETRDMASRAYLEASRNNYGLAVEHASRLYDRLGEFAQQGEDPVRSIAQDALGRRDSVMGMLAKADGTARTELQDLTARLLSAESSAAQTRARAK
jgi:hypothetical protein